MIGFMLTAVNCVGAVLFWAEDRWTTDWKQAKCYTAEERAEFERDPGLPEGAGGWMGCSHNTR